MERRLLQDLQLFLHYYLFGKRLAEQLILNEKYKIVAFIGLVIGTTDTAIINTLGLKEWR